MASVLGHFGEGETLLNGQTVKTKIVTEELQRHFGKDRVITFDTHGGWKTLLKAPFQVFAAFKNSTYVVMFPAQNGLRVYAPLLSFYKRLFRRRHIHYVVIGGWLPAFLKQRPSLAKTLRKFDGIYAETNTVKTALEQQGFTNVSVMPNCKKLTALSAEELVYPSEAPYKLCTFSRVMREKGIETAINAIQQVNDQLGYTAYTLDIYGQVDAGQTEWFEDLKNRLPSFARYGGCVDANKSVEVLQHCFALLFPTHFYTEGIPGTIIDAYAAGVPVISAKWESYADMVEEGKTGLGYEFDNTEQLQEMLLTLARHPQTLLDMKRDCLQKATAFLPESAVRVLIDKMEGH